MTVRGARQSYRMADPVESCLICGVPLDPAQTVYEVRHFFDPIPPSGYACSERCARTAEEASRLRSYLTFDLLSKG